jgi:hypothetical protein
MGLKKDVNTCELKRGSAHIHCSQLTPVDKIRQDYSHRLR